MCFYVCEGLKASMFTYTGSLMTDRTKLYDRTFLECKTSKPVNSVVNGSAFSLFMVNNFHRFGGSATQIELSFRSGNDFNSLYSDKHGKINYEMQIANPLRTK